MPRGGWNRGRKKGGQCLVISKRALEQLQNKDLVGYDRALQLCRDMTLERREAHVIVNVSKVLEFPDDVISEKKQPKRDSQKYPWNQVRTGAVFLYDGTYHAAKKACLLANKRLWPKVFAAEVRWKTIDIEAVDVVVVRRVS